MTQSSDGKKGEPKAGFDKALIRELADLLKETDLTEIEIEQNGLRLRVGRQISGTFASVPTAAPATATSASASAPAPTDVAKHPGAVASPMVGTIYLAPGPNAPNFVKIGDTVKEGQTLVIVEAMKTMNHIPSPRAGKVTQILVQNAQPVEYGEPLLIIE